MAAWPRAQEYSFFTKMVPPGYSLTADLDVTKTREAISKANKKFYTAFLWLVTKSANSQAEFRTDELDGVPGYRDVLHPIYPVLHDDKSLSMMWTQFDDSFSGFYERCIADYMEHGQTFGFLSQPDNPPQQNSTVITQLPLIEFRHFAFHLDVNKPHLPSFAASKFFEDQGKTNMPFSVNVNHCISDGWHVHRFMDELQHSFDNPGEWM